MSGPIVQLPGHQPGTPAWQEQRTRMVGGSEIAPLLGIGKWDSRFSLWHRKQGLTAPEDDNPEMEWGRLLEPVIVAKYRADHPDLLVKHSAPFTRTDRPYQLASPDALVGALGLLEVKTARFDDEWGEPGTDEIPVYYRAQCLWYLDTLERDWCDVAVLIAGSDYREYRVTYNADEARMMRDAAQEFIASIEADQRPDIDAHTATYSAIREQHPDIEPISVELPGDLALSYLSGLEQAEQAADNKRRLTSLVADHMGSAHYATWNGTTIADRRAKNGGTPYVQARRLKTKDSAA